VVKHICLILFIHTKLPPLKKLLLLLGGISCAVSLSAQKKEIHYSNGSYFKQCISFRKTKPLKELIAERDARRKNMPAEKIVPHVAADAEVFERTVPKPAKYDFRYIYKDGARQTTNGTENISSTIVNIDGQTGLQSLYPLDPNGMIGSNYYVQTVNCNFAIYDKSGNVVQAATDFRNLFDSLGPDDIGDPVTVYDKIADRWVITELEGPYSNVDTLLLAVSETNDPLGSYYLYAFDPDISNFNDYPKYSVWADGYYMTCNCQPNDYVMVYDRTNMLIGNPLAGLIAIPFTGDPANYGGGAGGSGIFCPMMLDCDGTLPPYGEPNYLLYYWDDNWGAGGNDELIINKVSVDWSNQTGTITVDDTLPTAAFNSTFPGGLCANVAQPGSNISSSSYDIEALDGFISYRIPYLRWSSYNSAVLSYVVNVDSVHNIAGVRWYELRQDTTSKKWSIYQQSTYAPNDGVSRWMPSIAMDQNGNIGLAYSVADSISVFPGCRYTGRMSCDTLNEMTVTEVNAYSGDTIVYTPENGGNRWGDYSHLSVDPIDGISFWHTNMYANKNNEWYIGSRIYSFQIPKCTLNGTDNIKTANAAVTAYQNGETLNVKGTNLPEGQRVVVELFDVNGKRLMQNIMVTSSNTLETSFNISTLAKAIYIVRLGNDNFQRVIKVNIH
jgi:hypothetical protein